MCHFNNISCMDISRLNNNNMSNNMFMPSQRICRLLLLVDKPTYRPLKFNWHLLQSQFNKTNKA